MLGLSSEDGADLLQASMAWASVCSQPPWQLEGELGAALYLTLLQGVLPGDSCAALHGMP